MCKFVYLAGWNKPITLTIKYLSFYVYLWNIEDPLI